MILTPRRQAILAEIRRNGRFPSYPQMMQHLGVTSKASVHYQLVELRNHGYVTWAEGFDGTMRLTRKGLLAVQGYRLLFTCDQDGIHEAG